MVGDQGQKWKGRGDVPCEQNTGDLALWWEVARGWRLGRRIRFSIVAAREAHTILASLGIQSGEISSVPGACVPRPAWCSTSRARFRLVYGAATAQPVEDPAKTTDETPTLASVGLTDQVE